MSKGRQDPKVWRPFLFLQRSGLLVLLLFLVAAAVTGREGLVHAAVLALGNGRVLLGRRNGGTRLLAMRPRIVLGDHRLRLRLVLGADLLHVALGHVRPGR